jgi:hypothetical protein
MFDKNRADKIEKDQDNLRMFVWMSVITLRVRDQPGRCQALRITAAINVSPIP